MTESDAPEALPTSHPDDPMIRGASARPVWLAITYRLLLLVAIGTIAFVGVSVANALNLESPVVRPPLIRPPSAAIAENPGTDPSGAGAGGPAGPAREAASPTGRVNPDWLASVATATGIPVRALSAYASADLTVDAEQPACGLGWNTVAAIGWIESGHGSHDGAVLDKHGYPVPAIRGIALNGAGVAAIRDTDGGILDGDRVWDRAVGPMQFIPDTWARWGADGNGDGKADPNQIDDAALATARYLCASGDLSATEDWRAAVLSYNHSDQYVADVAAVANHYAGQA